MNLVVSIFVLLFGFVVAKNDTISKSYKIVYITDKGNPYEPCQLLSTDYVTQHRMLHNSPIYVTSFPRIVDEESHDSVHEHVESGEHVVQVYGRTKEIAELYFNTFCKKWIPVVGEKSSADEVIPLIISGPPSNRIDLVFMGDGYTENEREQMLDDMRRLVHDIFTGNTFAPYLPLFNVWIVFRPSVESGIGTGGVPKNTAFRLYRDGTQLRGVYCGNPSAARAACQTTGPDACDFPTLIGNSPYYGGLGGEFTISTSSETSGTIVLRHELGHNFGQVGEEYDGGTAYFGANFASSLPQAENKWRAWLSDPPIRAEASVLRLQDYPWYLLENGPRSYTFTSDGNFDRWFLRFTASGCPEDGSLGITLDGLPLEWVATGEEDRMFYTYYDTAGFSAGTHRITFEQNFPPSGSFQRQLCSLTLHEYLNEPDFHWNEFYSGYRTWRLGNTLVGYRPTNEFCLMRNMSSPFFCKVCVENMWLQFFSTVSAIDNVTTECVGPEVHFKLYVIPLAQFRSDKSFSSIEEYSLVWYKDGEHLSELDNMYEFTMDRVSAIGSWRASLQFITEQVRQDPNNLLNFEVSKTIPSTGPCP